MTAPPLSVLAGGRLAGLLAGLAAAYLLLAVGAVAGSALLVGTAALAAHVAEHVLVRVEERTLPGRLAVVPAEAHVRLLVVQLFVLLTLLRSGVVDPGGAVLLALAVAAHQVLRTVHSLAAVADAEVRTSSSQARGLAGDSLLLPPTPAALGRGTAAVVLHATAAIPAALLWAATTGSAAPVAPAAALAVVVALAVTLAAAPHLLGLARTPLDHRRWELVRAAAARHGPVVLLYSPAAPTGLHHVEMWLDALDALPFPGLVVLRDPDTFARLRPCASPAVCLPRGRDVTALSLPSARVALFPSNAGENVRLLRNPDLRTVLVGHGDSDKAVSANPFVRVYHEVWVAGEAGRQRVLDADIGVRPEAVRVVGRPQVRGVLPPRRPLEPPYRVLYAPTWEGARGDSYESSVAHSGREIVRALLDRGDVRVVYRPHPWTGRVSGAAARASADIVATLAAAGPGHRAVLGSGVDLVPLFNEADVLVADVSAVLTDFLASGKPYVVTDGSGGPEQEFRARVRAARGAYVIGPRAAGLEHALTQALLSDPLRRERAAVREDLLGPAEGDPVAPFARAVAAAVEQASRACGERVG